MTKFNTKYGAITLVGLAAIYMILSLATGRSATAEPLADLSAPLAGVDVWQATSLLAEKGENVAVVDVRDAEHYALFHLPQSVSKPASDAAEVIDGMNGKNTLLLVADSDVNAAKLAGEVAKKRNDVEVHFLKEGVRAWYLTYVVPVPLFNEKPPPYGWSDAMQTVRAFVNDGKGNNDDVVKAVSTLSSAGYAPTQLQGKKKAPSGGPKKKISGGCG